MASNYQQGMQPTPPPPPPQPQPTGGAMPVAMDMARPTAVGNTVRQTAEGGVGGGGAGKTQDSGTGTGAASNINPYIVVFDLLPEEGARWYVKLMNVVAISLIFTIITLAVHCTLWGIVQIGFISVFLFPIFGIIPELTFFCCFTLIVLLINFIQLIISFLHCGVLGVLFTVFSLLSNIAVLYCASKIDPALPDKLERLKFWNTSGNADTPSANANPTANVTTV